MRQTLRALRNKIISMYLLAILLGVLGGFVGSLFLLAIHALDHLMVKAFEHAGHQGWSLGVLSAIVSMGMVYISWMLVKFIAPEASGSGVQIIEGVLLDELPIRWYRTLPVKFIGGVLAISGKLVLGREGPTIHIGGSLGAMISEWFDLSLRRRNSLIAAGAAAGLATAFNAPLAGIIFVMEEMRTKFKFSYTNFSVVVTCCVFAVIVLHLLVGDQPVILMKVYELPSLRSLWLFFIFGFVVGLVGLLFNIVLMKSLYKIDKLSSFKRNGYVLLIGLLVGYLAYRWPYAVGGGYEIIENALSMSPSFSLLISLVVVRFITGMLCYCTGVSGGIFAPMLALGTLLGLASSHFLQWIMVDMTVHSAMFAVAGMGALFAATTRAPITGILLVVEMTQNYSLILPLMVTCLTATTVVQLAGSAPIYSQLLNRTLKVRDKLANQVVD